VGDIFETVVRQATPIFNELLECAAVRAEVTHRKYNGQIFDKVLKVDKDQYIETPLVGVETFHTKRSIFAAKVAIGGRLSTESKVEQGDRVFIFFSDVDASLKDQIVASDGTTYNVKAVVPIRTIATFITVDS